MLIFIYGEGLYGQNVQFEFNQLKVGNTYTEITASSVIQDNNGYLWIGTKGSGVFRFNGSEFVRFDREKGLPSDFVLDVNISDNGSVWVSTLDGTVNITNDKVVKEQDSVFSQRVDKIIPAVGDSLFFLSENEIFLYTDSKVYPFDIPQLYNNEKVSALIYYDDLLYVGTSKGRLLMNKDIGEYDALKISSSPIISIKGLGENELAIVSNEDIYTLQNGKVRNFIKEFPNLYRAGVTDVLKDYQGTIWISSLKGLFSINENKVINYGPSNGLNATDIYDLHLDLNGMLWIAGGNSGVFNYRGDQFTYLNTKPENLGIITRIYQTTQGSTTNWVTTLGNGAYRISSKDTVNLADITGEEWLRNELFTSVSYGGGALWFGTSDGRLIKFKDGFIDSYSLKPYTNGKINSLARSKNGIWVATENGLILFTNTVVRYFDQSDGFNSSKINDIYSDEFNNLLIATDKGLYKLINGKVESFDLGKDQNVKITQISKSKDQDYWLSTLGSGLIRIRNDKVTWFTKNEGLSSLNTFNLFIETSRKIWFNTDNGLECIIINESGNAEETIAYGEEDGFYGISRYPHALSYSSNNLWVGTDNGITLVKRSPNILGNSEPKLFLKDISGNYGESPLEVDEELKKYINSDEVISIENDVTTLTFYFDCIDLIGKTDWVYRYRLLPAEKYWSPASTQRIVSFSNLKPGKYTLEFKASNLNETNSIEPIKINFSILPPWYESPWFLLVAGMGALFLVVMIVNLSISSLRNYNRKLEERIEERTREIQKQKDEIEEKNEEYEAINEKLKEANDTIHKFNKELKRKVSERTASLEEANKELAYLNKELDTFMYKASHDLLGPLARLKGLCHLGKLEVEEEVAVKYMSLLSNSADEMYVILKKLIDIISIRENDPKIKNVDYQKIIKTAFKEANVKNGLPFELDIINNYDKPISTDPELLKRVFYNLFLNSIQYSDISNENSKVKIDIVPNGKYVNFYVTDNGVGIREESKSHIFDMFYKGSERSKGSGLGLYISKVAMDKLGGKIRLVESTNGKTTFEISIIK
nr:ATP-binding protein [Marinigracilibium pacificum]